MISHAALALNPDALTETSGFYTFGEGTHFDVDHHLRTVDGAQKTQSVTLYGERTVKRPLPYPPQALWCVTIDYVDEPDRVIFLGYHRDMYSAEWVAHIGESKPFSAEFTDNLTALGCDLSS